MKRKILKTLLASFAVFLLSLGASNAGNAIYEVAGVQTQVQADSGVFYDASTQTLILRGNVVSDKLKDYRDNSAVITVYAEKGTVLPENSQFLFYNFRADTIDLSNADTSNVINMNGMFFHCKYLRNLNISGFDTSNVTNMENMFDGCSGLRELDVTGFDTSKVTRMNYMFNHCEGLLELDVSRFDTSNVEQMSGVFKDCSNLRELDVTGFDTSKVVGMLLMFDGCGELSELDVSGFDTSNVTSMFGMFRDCKSLVKLDLSGFDTSKVTEVKDMFRRCSGLQELNLSSFNPSNVTSTYYMFNECKALRELDLRDFDTSKVTEMVDMFSFCSNLKTIFVSDLWNVDQVKTSDKMFKGCTSLVGGNGTKYIGDHGEDATYAHIDKEGQPGYLTEAPKTKIVITKQPCDWYGTIGKKGKFSVEATGDGLSYEWQYNKMGVWYTYGLTGYDTPNFSVSMNAKNVKWPIHCVIRDKYGQKKITREVWLKDSSVPASVTITKQPSDWTGVYGKKASFSVTATGGGLIYQWQYRKGAGAWTNYEIATADAAVFKVTMNEKNVKWTYRCVITDMDGNTAITNEVHMKLKSEEPTPAGITITSRPSDFTGKIGKKATFTVTATGVGLTYEWQVKKATAWSAYTLAGYDTPTFQVSINEKTAKWTYRCVIRDASGNEVATNEVKIYVAE